MEIVQPILARAVSRARGLTMRTHTTAVASPGQSPGQARGRDPCLLTKRIAASGNEIETRYGVGWSGVEVSF